MSEEKKISIAWNTFDYAGLESRMGKLLRQAEQGSKLLVSLLEDEKKRRAALSDEEREAENKARDERRAKEKAAHEEQKAIEDDRKKQATNLLLTVGIVSVLCEQCGTKLESQLLAPNGKTDMGSVLSIPPCENCLEAASDY